MPRYPFFGLPASVPRKCGLILVIGRAEKTPTEKRLLRQLQFLCRARARMIAAVFALCPQMALGGNRLT
jgi:hypothetical protein